MHHCCHRYGEMVVSALYESPPNRQQVDTSVVEDNPAGRAEMQNAIQAELAAGVWAVHFLTDLFCSDRVGSRRGLCALLLSVCMSSSLKLPQGLCRLLVTSRCQKLGSE
eukprot:scaffold4078_cov23-Tisochrysis_lutea.AAC.6